MAAFLPLEPSDSTDVPLRVMYASASSSILSTGPEVWVNSSELRIRYMFSVPVKSSEPLEQLPLMENIVLGLLFSTVTSVPSVVMIMPSLGNGLLTVTLLLEKSIVTASELTLAIPNVRLSICVNR